MSLKVLLKNVASFFSALPNQFKTIFPQDKCI
jgi:hypothetical protein